MRESVARLVAQLERVRLHDHDLAVQLPHDPIPRIGYDRPLVQPVGEMGLDQTSLLGAIRKNARSLHPTLRLHFLMYGWSRIKNNPLRRGRASVEVFQPLRGSVCPDTPAGCPLGVR